MNLLKLNFYYGVILEKNVANNANASCICRIWLIGSQDPSESASLLSTRREVDTLFHFSGCSVSVHKGKPQMNHKLQIKVMCMKWCSVIGQTVGEIDGRKIYPSQVFYSLHNGAYVNCLPMPIPSAVRRRYYRRWLALMRLETERHLCPSELYVCPLTHFGSYNWLNSPPITTQETTYKYWASCDWCR